MVPDLSKGGLGVVHIPLGDKVDSLGHANPMFCPPYWILWWRAPWLGEGIFASRLLIW